MCRLPVPSSEAVTHAVAKTSAIGSDINDNECTREILLRDLRGG